jgi:PEP-CTERM motif
LQAGNTYYFGVISDSNADYGYIFPPIDYSNNGLTAVTTGNANYQNYGVPVFSGNGSAEIGLRLTAEEVPEPGSMVLLGTGALGLAGVLRRKLML